MKYSKLGNDPSCPMLFFCLAMEIEVASSLPPSEVTSFDNYYHKSAVADPIKFTLKEIVF